MISLRKSPKKAVTLTGLAVITAGCCVLGCHWLSSDSRLFDQYCNQYARGLLSEDTLSLHYALADPAAAGLDDLPVTLGEITLTDITTETVICENTQSVLDAFSPDRLSDSQQLTLTILKDTVDREQALLPYAMLWDMPSSSLGLPAQLPVLFAEYTFRSPEDIQTYLLLLSDTRRYFSQYADVLQQKAKAGYAPAAETIDAMLAQCQEFLGNEDTSHFLQTTFMEKCRELSLSEDTLQQLEKAHFRLLQTKLFTAYHALEVVLQKLYPLAHERCGLAGYPGGRDYYEASIRYLCGTDLSIEAIRKRLYRQLTADIAAAGKLDASVLSADDPYLSLSPEQMLTQLSRQTAPYFPAVATTRCTIKEVQPELQVFSSPAYYMVPPADDWQTHTIYINPSEALEGFSLYTTLAHEGFPGHLYQNVCFYATNPPLLRRLLSYGGYAEGWATYAESLISELCKDDYAAASAAWLDRSLNLCIASLLDISIHAEGWNLEKAAAFLADFGMTDMTSVEDLYQYIIENPGNYLRYYLGCLSFLDLRAMLRTELGKDFSLTDFHRWVLTTGPCSFPVLTAQVRLQAGLS